MKNKSLIFTLAGAMMLASGCSDSTTPVITETSPLTVQTATQAAIR